MGLLNQLFKEKPKLNGVYTLEQVINFNRSGYGDMYDFPYDEKKNAHIVVLRGKINDVGNKTQKVASQEFRNNLSNNGEYKGKDVEVVSRQRAQKQYGYIDYGKNRQYGRYR